MASEAIREGEYEPLKILDPWEQHRDLIPEPNPTSRDTKNISQKNSLTTDRLAAPTKF